MKNINVKQYANRVIIFFEEYNGHNLFQSEPQLVATANFASYHNQDYSDDYYQYARTLEGLATKETFNKALFSKKVWVSDWDVEAGTDVKALFEGHILSFTDADASEELTEKILSPEVDNAVFNAMTSKVLKAQFTSMRIFSESDLSQVKSRVNTQITVEEPKKHVDTLMRHMLISKVVGTNDQSLVEDILNNAPVVTPLTAKEIEAINNNIVHLEKLSEVVVQASKDIADAIEEAGKSLQKIDWNALVERMKELLSKSNSLREKSNKVLTSIEGAEKAELMNEYKPVYKNAKGLEKFIGSTVKAKK